MAEFTVKTIVKLTDPNLALYGKKAYHVTGTCATNSDTITIGEDMITVKGAVLYATDGTLGTCTYGTNVVTVTNGSTKTWSGLVWGI